MQQNQLNHLKPFPKTPKNSRT
jgi:uncharacterized coiled-coil protein SlyX